MARVVKTKVEIEGRVHEETVVIEGEELTPWEEGHDFRVVGKSVNRIDARERVTGAARYTYDMHPAGMLYAAVLRSPHPHARIVAVDTSRAAALPGVRAALSSANAPDIKWYSGHSKLFDSMVRFVGEEVAAVAADDMETVRDALKLMDVKYEVLPFITDMREASRPGALQIHPRGNVLKGDGGREGDLYSRGDPIAAFKSADIVVEATYSTSTQLHNSLETHGSVVMWEGDELTVWESTQYIYGVRSRVADALGMPVSKVRVICEYMGGGFGSKGQTLKQPIIAALLSKEAGRPVKLMLNRTEENTLSGNRGETIQKLKVGAMNDGTLVAIDLETLYGVGAYGGWAGAVGGPAKELYKCANVRTLTLGVRTNLGSHAAFRAPGYVEGTFALESALDEICDRLGMDPVEFRRKNYAEGDQTSDLGYTSKYLLESYDKVLELSGIGRENKLPAKGELGANGNWKRGIGIASQTWSGGGGPPAHALVRVNPDGTVEIMAGTQDIGTGTKTTLSQIAAEELGVPLESISFRAGDTQKGPFGPASWGSITTPSMGPAVRAAAADARNQLLEIASFFMEVPASTLVLQDGIVTIEGRPESRRPLKKILDEVGDYMVTGKGFRGPNPTQPLRTWGAQLAEVEVNMETGQVRLVRIAAAHDVGRVINPKGLASQFYGGILQGMGFGLTEERIVDARSGHVLNADLEEYKVPTIVDTPEMRVAGINRADTLANHVGAKGAGEPPIIPTAAAIANAIFNATGVRVTALPITPRRMLEALKANREEGKNAHV
ncbi:MAG: xanthine dehydrogenase family protein molybdopterin-binding subunit [Chloroflexota bacterium]